MFNLILGDLEFFSNHEFACRMLPEIFILKDFY